MADEAAVLETPAGDVGAGESSVNSEGSSQESSRATGGEGGQGQQGTGGNGDGGQQGQQGQQQGSNNIQAIVSDATKREALKAIDPSLPGFIRDALQWRSSLTKEFPGGVKEAVQLKTTLAEVGGVEGLQELRNSDAEWSALDQAYIEGKPEFVQRIAEGDPEAFARMVPLAIEQLAKTNGETFQHVMARVLVNTFDGAGLSNAVRSILQAIPEKSDKGEANALHSALKEIYEYIESFRPIAQKVPEKKVDAKEQELTQREQRFQQQQAQALVRDVDRESITHRDSIIAREIKPFGDWQTMDPDRRGAVASWISQCIGQVLQKDRRFMDRRQNLIANGDRVNLAKLEKDKLTELVPDLVPKAAKVFGVAKAAGKQQGKNDQQQQQSGKQTAKPAQGYQQRKEAPRPGQIDRSKTTSDMIFEGKAVLTDGTKVQWPV